MIADGSSLFLPPPSFLPSTHPSRGRLQTEGSKVSRHKKEEKEKDDKEGRGKEKVDTAPGKGTEKKHTDRGLGISKVPLSSSLSLPFPFSA